MRTAIQHATNGGTRIAYETAGSGEPVLLMQGLGYGRSGWGRLPELLAADFTVLIYDNRGFGDSDKPPGPYSTAALADDAAAVLDAAGIERAHVLGLSLGGMAAQELALRRPERVHRLVLLSTTPGGARAFPMPAVTVQLMLTAATLPPELALRRLVENAIADSAPSALVEQILAYRLAHPPDQAGWEAQASAGITHDAFGRLEALRAPTLVIHGRDDTVVDARNGELLAKSIPDARLELLPGCGHLAAFEQPVTLAGLVHSFLVEDRP